MPRTHDGTQLEAVIDDENISRDMWADTAYRSRANKGFRSQIHRKKPRGKPMPQNVERANRKKSRVRALVEHVFAHTKHHGKLEIRTIGLANLVYNMKSLIFFESRAALGGQFA